MWDMIQCPHCSREFPGDKVNSRHLSKCNPSSSPAVEPCLCGHHSTSLTQMKRHRAGCSAWKARDVRAVHDSRKRATSLARYGVADASQAPEVVARRKTTNLQRYGAENPFAKEASTFEKVQKSLEGKRPVFLGEENRFSRDDVKAKIRQTMTEKYGAENPQQVPEISQRTQETNLSRYGGTLMGSPSLREKIETTNFERFGTATPAKTPEVKERIRQTNLATYGVSWTGMDPEIRRRQLETMHAHYGSHFFSSEEGKTEVRRVLMEKYGVEFPGAIDGHWEKAIATFRRNHEGLQHPLQLGFAGKGPNKFEARVHSLAPWLRYMGDHSFWRWLPKLNHHKNPDFIVPGPDPEHPLRDITKVVEAFGDFWHSRMFTGRAPFDHEQDLIDAYRDVGIDCLVLWESEVKSDPEGVRARLIAFAGGVAA